jgi:hypothetical protein
MMSGMSRDEAIWRRLYNLFDPTRRLELGEQDLYVSRPGSVAAAVAGDLKDRFEPRGKWVFCGSMGSGKSSELIHLGAMLDNTHTLVGLDLLGSVTRIDLVEPAEVLFLIGAAAVRTAKDLLDHEIDSKLVVELRKAFDGVLDEGHGIDLARIFQGVALFTVNVAAPGVGAVAGAARGVTDAAGGLLGDRARLTLSRTPKLGGLARPLREGEADFEKLREAVDEILLALPAQRPVVVLVDGLDKVQELPAIRNLFTASRILALPAAQVVYTAPITLMLEAEWQAAGGTFRRARLTNLVIRRPDVERVTITDDEIAANREVMASVIDKRLKPLRLSRDEVFEPGCVDALVTASGGLMRDLVHLVNRAVRRAYQDDASRVGQSAVDSAVEEIRKEYVVTLNTRRVDELRHVRKWGEPSGAEGSNEPLLGGYVLPYSNGRIWCEPHPILRGLRPEL